LIFLFERKETLIDLKFTGHILLIFVHDLQAVTNLLSSGQEHDTATNLLLHVVEKPIHHTTISREPDNVGGICSSRWRLQKMCQFALSTNEDAGLCPEQIVVSI
jgi:hypothetical protein